MDLKAWKRSELFKEDSPQLEKDEGEDAEYEEDLPVVDIHTLWRRDAGWAECMERPSLY